MEGVAAATGASLHTGHTLPFTPGAAGFLPSAGQLIFQWQKPLSRVWAGDHKHAPPMAPQPNTHTLPRPPAPVALSPSGPRSCTLTHFSLWA